MIVRSIPLAVGEQGHLLGLAAFLGGIAPRSTRGRAPRRRAARRPRPRPRIPGPSNASPTGRSPSGRIPTRTSPSGDLPVDELDLADRDAPARGVALQQVHRRRADEPGHEHVCGVVVHVLRRADLLQDALGEHRDPVAERDRLDLVVGHVDRRDADAVVQPLELGPHLDAELGVQVRERLVQQEHLGLANERPAHRHALALAARELPRPPAEQVLEPEHLGSSRRPAVGRPPAASAAAAGRTRGSSPPSCAGTARSSGTPSRCRGPSAGRRSPRGRRSRSCRR